MGDPRHENTQDGGVEAVAVASALTSEELACVVHLVGGEFEAADVFGLVTIDGDDDPVFDIGFRSLLVRGLVRLDGDSVGLEEEISVLGRILADASTVWTVFVETSGGPTEPFGLISSRDAGVCLVPGPPGVYSYRPITTDLPREVAGMLDLASGIKAAGADDGDVICRSVVQRLRPKPLESLVLECIEPGQFQYVGDRYTTTFDKDALAEELERTLSA